MSINHWIIVGDKCNLPMENPFLLIEQRLEAIEQSLNHLLSTVNTNSPVVPDPVEEKQKFSISELSIYLKVSKSTIHRYKNNRMFPFYQAGRTVFFKKNEVDKALLAFKTGKTIKY